MSNAHHHYDPLLECLSVFANLHNRPISIDALISGLPIEPGKPGPELFSLKSSKGLFSRVAKRAGFATRLIKRDISQLSSLLLPCILILKNRNACVLESIDLENNRARVIFPEVEDGEEWLELSELENEYIGFNICVYMQYLTNVTSYNEYVIQMYVF